jgi:two-component system LytT family response regulator
MPKTLALVEDTLDSLNVIRHYVEKKGPALRIVGEARTVDEAYDLLARQRPDIALLDIDIIGGTSFDVLARLDAEGQPLPQLIFITAYGVVENATKALRYAALDFITKTVDEHLLSAALDRAIARLDAHDTMLDEIRLLLDQQRRGDRFDRISVQLAGGVRRLVPVGDILYFEADGVVTKLVLRGERIVANVNLGHFKRTLQDDYDFLLIHQSYLVNADCIHHFDPRQGEVKLTTGERLAASKTGTVLLREYFKRKEERTPSAGGVLGRLRAWVRGR